MLTLLTWNRSLSVETNQAKMRLALRKVGISWTGESLVPMIVTNRYPTSPSKVYETIQIHGSIGNEHCKVEEIQSQRRLACLEVFGVDWEQAFRLLSEHMHNMSSEDWSEGRNTLFSNCEA